KVSGQFQYVPHLQLAILSPSQLLYPLDIRRNWGAYCGGEQEKEIYCQYSCDEYSNKKENGILFDKKLKELQSKLNAYQQSTCWKITRPIRIVGDIIKRIKG